MSDTKKTNTPNEEFKPPNFPFTWLAGTFIAPLIVLILPNIIKDQTLLLEFRIAVALGVLSIMLFISCIYLWLKIYDLSYSIQITKYAVYDAQRRYEEISTDLQHTKTLLENIKSNEQEECKS